MSTPTPSGGLRSWVQFLYRWRYCILILFALVSSACLYVHYEWIFVLTTTREIMCGTPQTPSGLAIQQGRTDSDFPSPTCCVDAECLPLSKGRFAVLTTLRSNDYYPLLEHLSCSLQHSNPSLKLLTATVQGDLSANTLAEIRKLPNVELIYWDEFRVENALRARFSLNWVKLRAWEMDNWDVLLMIDADTLVVGDVQPLFSLPAHFATVLDQDKFFPGYNALGRQQGGVVLLRPCRAVASHMMHLAGSNKTLQFAHHHAEQSFLDWYFRFSRWTLPIRYNAINYLLREGGNVTSSGAKPIIVHYAGTKNFELHPDKMLEQRVALGCKRQNEL